MKAIRNCLLSALVVLPFSAFAQDGSDHLDRWHESYARQVAKPAPDAQQTASAGQPATQAPAKSGS